MPAPDPLMASLGLPHDDPVIQAMLRRFAITRVPTVKRDAFDEFEEDEITVPQDWLSNLARGIEFGFEDEAAFTGEPTDVWGLGPMLLTQIYLYADHPEAAPYDGTLPYGLARGDDREAVRRRLDPLARERRSRALDTWDFGKVLVTAGYLDNDMLSFVVLLCQPPSAEREAVTDYPDAGQLAAALGRPVGDHQTQNVLAPLGYPHRFQRLDESRAVMDLRNDLGAYLEFETTAAGMVLAQVLLLGDRRFGSAIWHGPLPGGLRFGAGWAEVLTRAHRPPDTETERDFILYADWQSERHVIRIEYSTMTNEVIALSLHLPSTDA